MSIESQKRSWKPWGDHPVVVAVGAIAALTTLYFQLFRDSETNRESAVEPSTASADIQNGRGQKQAYHAAESDAPQLPTDVELFGDRSRAPVIDSTLNFGRNGDDITFGGVNIERTAWEARTFDGVSAKRHWDAASREFRMPYDAGLVVEVQYPFPGLTHDEFTIDAATGTPKLNAKSIGRPSMQVQSSYAYEHL